MAAEDDDFADFLAKVNEIESLVKGLSSEDKQTSAHAIESADRYLDTHQGFDRTVVNRSTSSRAGQDASVKTVGDDSERAAFCQSMEQDAAERAQRRAEREKKGRELKRAGNAAFKSGHHEVAVQQYTAAIESMPWDVSLYTNRAQASFRLTNYESAINDCDQALKIEPKTLKAYVHKGKALAALGRYKEALECYADADKVLPEFAKTIQGYRVQVETLSEGEATHTDPV